MKIIQIILSIIIILRIGGILLKKASKKNINKSDNSLVELLNIPSMLLAVLTMKVTGDFTSLLLIITCVIYNELCILIDKNMKCFEKIVFSILGVIGIILFVLLFLYHEKSI